MVQPRGRPRRKRHASHTAAAVAPSASPAGNLEEEGLLGDGNEATQKRVRTAQPSQLPLPLQDMFNIINEPLPLGLRLKKSPSFVDLICTCLSKKNSTKENSTEEISTKEISTKGRSAMKDIVSKPPLKKDVVKASNFPANFLKIGNWEYTSQYEGDLVAKCYYAKHKLVWEVLNNGLKSKIEVQWLDITALKATCPEEGDGTLELMLSRPPMFFQETHPQPRKHTLWLAAPDFTCGQAIMCRRHVLRCSSSVLSRNFEKLIQCDERLNELSRQPIIMSDSPFIGSISSIFGNPNESAGPSSMFAHHVSPYDASSVVQRDGVKHHQPLNIGATASDVQAKIVVQEQRNLNLCNHASPEVPKEFQEIAESLLSDTHALPSADEKYLLARVDSFSNLIEKGAAPSTVSVPERNDTIAAGEVGYDAFAEELGFCFEDEEQWAPAGRTVDGGAGPPAISRKESVPGLFENLYRRIPSMSELFDIAED
ncbi:hypothetical protein CFC21_089742 [Triticum aestivum]|uniref:TRF2/HOY1 PH-like domain-containing protein n=3 Tax=Triticum TaxID=4564 RepID=A0A9R0YW64_TRITD|nr:uncharacterized protein LOC123139063 [Triticum aestivum]KAF7086456.1 hypothetical protein CFC21_089742 [Triticum aestivum]VAI62109.1 unnamed protein product [Triticum turgidum subsp. durum]